MEEKQTVPTGSDDVAIYVAPNKRMTMAVILMAALIGPCMFGYGLSTALVTIGTEMNNFALVAWLFTGSNLVQMVMQPLVPAISSKITLPRLVLIGMFVQIVTTAGFLFAPNMGGLIVFRTIQGLSGAFIFTGCMALGGQIVPPGKRATVMGINMACNGLGSVLGPILAGLCCDAGNWRIWGGIVLAVVVVVTILYMIFYPKGVTPVKGHKFDGKGTVLLAITFIALACLLQLSGSYWAWLSPTTFILAAVCIISLVLFVRVELKVERSGGTPAFRISLFKRNAFLVATLCALLICIATNGLATYIPSYGQTILGLTATQSSLGYTLGSALVIVISLFNGIVFGKKRWFKGCTAIGCIAACIAALALIILDTRVTAMLYTILVIGYSMWTAWLSSVNFTIGQMLLPTDEVLDATAGITSMQMVGAFLGVSINAAFINSMGYKPLFVLCIVVMVAAMIIMFTLKDPLAKTTE